jgi:hypothetical protein
MVPLSWLLSASSFPWKYQPFTDKPRFRKECFYIKPTLTAILLQEHSRTFFADSGKTESSSKSDLVVSLELCEPIRLVKNSRA